MLRLISNGNVATKSVNSLATTLIRCMSVQQIPQNSEQRTPLRERLQVNLCGQISESPVNLDNGTTVIPFRTKNDHNEHYAKHRAILRTTRLQNFLADHVVEGQRVYVSGAIGYSEFQNAKGQRQHSGYILANQVYRCDDDEGSMSDLNEVQLFGRVEQQPNNTEKSTFLHVSTWFFDRNTQTNKKKFHSILVQDNDNMRQLASCAEIGANVFIHGFLSTQSVRTQDEKWRTMYFIRPNKLIFTQKGEKSHQVEVDEF